MSFPGFAVTVELGPFESESREWDYHAALEVFTEQYESLVFAGLGDADVDCHRIDDSDIHAALRAQIENNKATGVIFRIENREPKDVTCRLSGGAKFVDPNTAIQTYLGHLEVKERVFAAGGVTEVALDFGLNGPNKGEYTGVAGAFGFYCTRQ